VYRRPVYPLGFPVDLITNSTAVIDSAEDSWGSVEQQFEGRPLELRVDVGPGPKGREPSFRIERHLLSIVSDRSNYALADLDELFACCVVTEETVADRAWFRWFYLDAILLSMLAQRHTVPVHAGCVAGAGGGVLLFGSSGAGKSTLTWACARAGWTLVSDDAAWLLPGASQPTAVGRPQQVRLRPDAPRHFPELEGKQGQARPNGKVAIELRPREFPSIRTASRTAVNGVVFLDRGEGSAELAPMERDEALAKMLRDCVPYRDEVHARHAVTVARLADLPAWRMRYSGLDEGIALVEQALMPATPRLVSARWGASAIGA